MSEDSILIVDDNPLNLKLARFLLNAEGFEVSTATDAEEAQAMVAVCRPRLILMDIQLPGIDGLEFTRRLKADPATRGIIVLALTAYAMSGDEERARRAGCDGYITKPIDTRTLGGVVRGHLVSQPKTQPAAPASDYHDLRAQLRHDFLAQGIDETRRILTNLNEEFNPQKELRLVHRWAGIAGTLGWPEIGTKAREIERFLENPGEGSKGAPELALMPSGEFLSRIRSEFLTLQEMFARGSDAWNKPPLVSQRVRQVLDRKEFGIAGFEEPEARRLSEALASVGAVARTVEESGSLQEFDAAIVNAQDVNPAQKNGTESLVRDARGVLIVTGAGSNLLGEPGMLEPSVDFLLSPWDAQEMLLRACRILSNARSRTPASGSGWSGAGDRAQPFGTDAFRVLVADDDPAIGALVAAALKDFGVECHLAQDGRAALDRVHELLPDLLVLDVRMPDIDGLGVLQTLKRDERTRHIKVILLTARNEESEIMRGFGCGADDYVTKPFSPMELAARVTRFSKVPRQPAPAQA